jgi:hypothetical protein
MSIVTILLLLIVGYLAYKVYQGYTYVKEKVEGLPASYYYTRKNNDTGKSQFESDGSLMLYIIGGALVIAGAYFAYNKIN